MRGPVIAAMLMFPASAAAQDTFCAAATACTTSISVSSATTIVGIGATMLTRIRERKIALLDDYVRQNEIAILQAVAMGGGDTLADLADLAGLREEDLRSFAARLRARRDEIASAFERTDAPGYLGALVLRVAEE